MRTFVLRSTVIPRKSESRVSRSTRSSFQIRDIFNGIVALDTNGYNTVLYCSTGRCVPNDFAISNSGKRIKAIPHRL